MMYHRYVVFRRESFTVMFEITEVKRWFRKSVYSVQRSYVEERDEISHKDPPTIYKNLGDVDKRLSPYFRRYQTVRDECTKQKPLRISPKGLQIT